MGIPEKEAERNHWRKCGWRPERENPLGGDMDLAGAIYRITEHGL